MKKMGYTKLESKSVLSFLGRSIFMILFALCFSITASAQLVGPFAIPSDSSAIEHNPITEKVAFTDDNSGDKILYSDADTKNGTDFPGGRADTITFCPENKWDRIRVTFTEFDVAAFDTLFAFDGNKAEVLDALDSLENGSTPAVKDRARLIGIGSGSGVGVSRAYGGWIDATCDPGLNASGCITFIFKTTNDGNKGTGWEAWVESVDRGLAIEAPDDLWERAECEDEDGDAPVMNVAIVAAEIAGGCADEIEANLNDMIEVAITGPGGVCVLDTVPAGDALPAMDFPVGHYKIVHTLISDRAKTATSTLTVVAPNLVANDNVVASIGNGCKVSLGLDNLLEGAVCEPNAGVAYEVVITDGCWKRIGYL